MSDTNSGEAFIYDAILDWSQKRFVQEGLEFVDDGLFAFQRVWEPACARFGADPRWRAEFRATQRYLRSRVEQAADFVVQSAKERQRDTITQGDIWRGMHAFVIIKAFTPRCPRMSDIDALKTEIAA